LKELNARRTYCVVGDGEARHSERYGFFAEVIDLADAVEAGEFGVNMQMNEGRSFYGFLLRFTGAFSALACASASAADVSSASDDSSDSSVLYIVLLIHLQAILHYQKIQTF